MIEHEKKPCGKFPKCVYIVSGNVINSFLLFCVAGMQMWKQAILDYENKGNASWEAEQQTRRSLGHLTIKQSSPGRFTQMVRHKNFYLLPSIRQIILGSFVIIAWLIY